MNKTEEPKTWHCEVAFENAISSLEWAIKEGGLSYAKQRVATKALAILRDSR
jgi:hypothetical protein